MTTLEISLYFYGHDLDPEAVTKSLGIAPDVSGRRGDTRTTSTGKLVVQKVGVWGYNISTRSEDLAGGIRDLLDQLIAVLGPRDQILRSLPQTETGFIEILFSMISREGSVNCEVELTESQVRALASFGLPLRFTLLASPP